jgi:hypothetical protein
MPDPNLIGLVGTVLQKNALAAYNRQMTKLSSCSRTGRTGEHERGAGMTDKLNEDIATISRAAIAALEAAQALGDDAVIRHGKSADETSIYGRPHFVDTRNDG